MNMEWWLGGLDLNNPAPDDDEQQFVNPDEQNQPFANLAGEGVPTTEQAQPSVDNTVPSGDTGAGTGNTLSSDDDGSEDEIQSTPSSQTNIQKPYPGMIFDEWEEAKLHYNKYAKQVGFSIKASTSNKSAVDKEKDKCLFVCNKSGKPSDINEQEAPPVRQRNRTITKKTDCKARLRVKRRGKKWHVTMFIEEHNHPCIKKFSLKRYLRSHRGIPREEKEFIKLLHKVNLSAGRVMSIMAELYGKLANVPYVKKDVSYLMATMDDEHTEKDMKMLIEQFERMKKEDPGFMYKIHKDHANSADRIFWVDGAARNAYKQYSDCLSFDTTYMTNMYKMPFAPFIGINRYCQSIQLGCGFLRNETIADFVWLFEAFLEAMDGVVPVNFITDQDGAMRSAILIAFPGTCHRNCRWHIMQNAQSVLGNFMSKHEELRRELNETIDHSMTVDEFETRWADMILKHNVGDNNHLRDLYDLRSTFVPAFFKDRFFPFLQTTARSEGFNAVLKRYVSPNNSLTHFFQQYLKLQEKIDVAEDGAEFEMEDKVFRVWSDYPLEAQAMAVYTHPVYLRFRAELRKVTSYNANQVGVSSFDVVPIKDSVYGYGKRSYKVEANLGEATYNCECSKVSRDGILCCHILRIMVQLGAIDSIPEQYILPRWRAPEDEIVAQKIELPEVPTDRKLSNKERKLLRYGTLCNDFTEVAKLAATSDKGKALADKYMRDLEKELKSMKVTESAKRKSKQKTKTAEGGTTEMEIIEDVGEGSASHDQNVRDPTHTTSRGRPGEKRKKSGLHLKASKVVKCSVCSSTEHTSPNCPLKMTPGPEPKELDFLRNMV